MSKKFAKEILQELIWEEELDGLKVVQDRILDTGRWTVNHELVFQELETSKFYLTYFRIAATENQDERPFEFDPDMILCEEVFPKEKIIIVYERKKN